MNTSYIFLAPGFEEIEALTVLDVMRRAGMDVKTVSITDERNVAGAHGVTVTADLLYSETDFITPEWLILPGGMPGATNLSEFAPQHTACQPGSIRENSRHLCIARGGARPVGHSRRQRGHMLSRIRETDA